MEGIYRKEKTEILVYTRHPQEGCYPDGLAYSIHFAWSRDGKSFYPMNDNYGMLFAKGEIGADNTIQTKSLKHPFLFPMKDGGFGILSVRTKEHGEADEASRGRVLFWTTRDFIHFEEKEMLSLSPAEMVEEVACRYEEETNRYRLTWKTAEGVSRGAWTEDLERNIEGQSCCPEPLTDSGRTYYGIEAAECGNAVETDWLTGSRAIRKWKRCENVGVQVPQRITVSSLEELQGIDAVAFYSDGSAVRKKVCWELEEAKLSTPGPHTVRGTVVERRYPFPLAKGYADPVIFPWKGSYYFISTNDNTEDVGIYVRRAQEPEQLFRENCRQHLILDFNREKGFVQTFWAPEFHLIGGRLYILFAVGGEVWGPQSHLMRLKRDGDPLKAEDWEEPLRIQKKDGSWLADKGITLDMTYLKDRERSYMIWSYRENIGKASDTGSMLYLAEVDENTPWRLKSDPVLLSRPLYGWENLEGTINNEGPYTFTADDTVYLAYSGGAANGYTYTVGILEADSGADLLRPESWRKTKTPVLSHYSVKGVYGPGHNSFFTDPEGNLMVAYHGETSIDGHLRCSGIHRVHFGIDGAPVFDMEEQRDLRPEVREVSMQVQIRK